MKRDTKKVLAMLKGGTKRFRVVFTWLLEVLAILMGGGGRKKFPLFQSFGPAIFPFCSPTLPVINDQSRSVSHLIESR